MCALGYIKNLIQIQLTDVWLQGRGLHGLKTEARTRPVPEIVWPDPTRPERHG